MTLETMTKLGTVTVGVGGQASISFSNIPQSYTDLTVMFSARDTSNSGSQWAGSSLTFNGTTTGYYSKVAYGSNTGTGSAASASALTYLYATSSSATASVFGSTKVYISNYSGNFYKPIDGDTVTEHNSSATFLGIVSGLWSNTSPITSLTLTAETSFAQYSTFTLYGISNRSLNVVPPRVTGVSAVAGYSSVEVSFNEVAASNVTYTVTALSSTGQKVTATGTSSPITVPNLVDSTAYTCTIVASNAVGTSLPSAASGSVTTKTFSWSTITTSDASENHSWLKWSPAASLYMAMGQFNGFYMTSPNGTTWTSRTMPLTNRAYGISVAKANATATEKLVLHQFGASALSSTSSGTSWTTRTMSATQNWGGGSYSGTAYATYGGGSVASYSTDGITWTAATLPTTTYDSIGGNDGPVLFAQPWAQTTLATSTNGSTWTARAFPSTMAINNQNIQHNGKDKYVAVSVGETKGVYSTDNGATWTATTLPSAGSWQSLTYGQGVWAAWDANANSFITSSDGITWTARTIPVYATAGGTLAWGNDKFVIVKSSSSGGYVAS